ncbi:hypothetical protein BGZ80_006598 [Entomortierella chlamydospora]|uniref:Uncharacterized protein n=1 Tax=Entomortierella chlamydospora TaxID=101097 RepID=A0A9P6MGM7_9FUNG|nr:hypothetical protein BGZ80_006598 [Entomortierella chlamydospora]KAG0006116.1 hypothetical protein BGZ79_008662 [Entomortierella chlamydospora]
MSAHPDSKDPNTKKEENVFKQAWHSVEDALHLRPDPPKEVSPPEDVPPPVPPKDEKWLVKTVNKPVPQEKRADPSLWDKLLHKSHSKAEDDEEDAVSISVPADAALKCLGVQGNDDHLQEKKNYFKRMALRVKDKFEEDDNDLDSDSESEGDGSAKTEQEKLEHRQRKKLAPKVDPKEMKEAHQAIYGETGKTDEEAEKKLFGSWWGCHPRRSRAQRKLAKQQEAELERQRVLAELAAKRKAEQEAAEAAAKAEQEAAEAAAKAKRKWWQLRSTETAEQKAEQKAKEEERKEKEKERKERKSTTHVHQAIAAAAAYEAMKKYQEHKAKEGKVVSHAEMKAILAGMAMAECVKLFESRHDDDDDDDVKDDTVAEAGSQVLKLLELVN